NNSYTGQTSITSGILQARSTNALGATGIGNETFVSSGASLSVAFGVTGIAETIMLTGSGAGGFGALFGDSTATSITGPINLVGATSMGVGAGGTLTLSGTISESVVGNSLTHLGPGTLVLSGNTANTYTG